MGFAYPPQLKTCMRSLSSLSTAQIQAKYGYPSAYLASALRNRSAGERFRGCQDARACLILSTTAFRLVMLSTSDACNGVSASHPIHHHSLLVCKSSHAFKSEWALLVWLACAGSV
jgi:hypothetical protein